MHLTSHHPLSPTRITTGTPRRPTCSPHQDSPPASPGALGSESRRPRAIAGRSRDVNATGAPSSRCKRALADLNDGYLTPNGVRRLLRAAHESGGRGVPTRLRAVRGRDRWEADVGTARHDLLRRTSSGSRSGSAIHAGVNVLDAAHYGPTAPLAGAVNDARAMRDIAEGMGYRAQVLTDDQATAANVTGALRAAASELQADDSLMFTFAGHGSQLNDIGLDRERDGLDETICLYGPHAGRRRAVRDPRRPGRRRAGPRGVRLVP